MEYSIDINVLEDSIRQIRNLMEEIESAQNQIYMICSLLLSVGWTGESAIACESRFGDLDENFNWHKKRIEIAIELLKQLDKNAQNANSQAIRLASIWTSGFSKVLNHITSRFNWFGNGEGGVVTLNKDVSKVIHDSSKEIIRMYDSIESMSQSTLKLHDSCNEWFGARGYIQAAINEMGETKSKVSSFNEGLYDYEATISRMEGAAQATAQHILPPTPFDK